MVFESVRKTHRALVVEEDWTTLGMGAEIARAFSTMYLIISTRRSNDWARSKSPLPYARTSKRSCSPDEKAVIARVKEML